MATVIHHNKGMLLQLNAASLSLNAAMVQLYTTTRKFLEIDERQEENAYYKSMVAAYSDPKRNAESKYFSDHLMFVSEEADELKARFEGMAHD